MADGAGTAAWWPTAEQLARGLVAAARLLDEDPARLYEAGYGARARTTVAAALREVCPQLTWNEVGRLCGMANPDKTVSTAQGRDGWWKRQGEAALAAAFAAMVDGTMPAAPAERRPRSLSEAVRVVLAAGPATTAGLAAGLARWFPDLGPKLITGTLSTLKARGVVACERAPSRMRGPRSPMLWRLAEEGEVAAQDVPPQGELSPEAMEGATVDVAAKGARTLAPPVGFAAIPPSGGEPALEPVEASGARVEPAPVSLRDRLLAALTEGSATTAQLIARLGGDLSRDAVSATLCNLRKANLVDGDAVEGGHVAGRPPIVWRLGLAATERDGSVMAGFKPRACGGVVGRMAAADMPAAAEVVGVSSFSGSRAAVTAPKAGPSARGYDDDVGRNPADQSGDNDERRRVLNLRARARPVPWHHIAVQVGKPEPYLRGLYDPQYRREQARIDQQLGSGQ